MGLSAFKFGFGMPRVSRRTGQILLWLRGARIHAHLVVLFQVCVSGFLACGRVSDFGFGFELAARQLVVSTFGSLFGYRFSSDNNALAVTQGHCLHFGLGNKYTVGGARG